MIGRLPRSLLEDWMRDYYFHCELDIGSSGVSALSVRDLREATGIEYAEMDAVELRDAPPFGGLRLRRLIAERWGGGDPETVVVTHGGSEAIFLAFNAVVGPGDEVVVAGPGYHSYGSLANALQCTTRCWQLEARRGFRPDLKALREVVNNRTRLIAVNFPHNPTGVTLTEAELRELVAIAEENEAFLLWDDAFGELTYDAPPLPSAATMSPLVVTVGTLSKAFGLPGLRVGWCVAAPDVIQRMATLRDVTTLHLSPLIEFLAERVLLHADAIVKRVIDVARANRELVTEWSAQAPQVEAPVPAGGVTTFPHILGFDDTRGLCRYLAERAGVLLVPGDCFDDPTRVRLGFGGTTAELGAGLLQLDAALALPRRSISMG